MPCLDWKTLVSDENLHYFDLISLHIKENVLKDPVYTCIECGRLKNKDLEISGTLCPQCDIANSSISPFLNRFTKVVQDLLYDIEIKWDRNKIFTNPSPKSSPLKVNTSENSIIHVQAPLKMKIDHISSQKFYPSSDMKLSSEIIINKVDRSIQTDVSFDVNDEVSFMVKRKAVECDKVIEPKKLRKVETTPGVVVRQDVDGNNENCVILDKPNESEIHSIMDEEQLENEYCQKVKSDEMSQTKLNIETEENSKSESLLTNIQEQFIETEMIASSVDIIDSRKVSTSPLLFSQETKDVVMCENKSGDIESSDLEDCINTTPPHENKFTCPKINPTQIHEIATSDCNIHSTKAEHQFSENAFDVNDQASSKQNTPVYTTQSLIQNREMNYSTECSNTNSDFIENQNTSPQIQKYSENMKEKAEPEQRASEINDFEVKGESHVNDLNRHVSEEEVDAVLTQNTEKISKYNLKIVVSSIADDDNHYFNEFSAIFNPVVENDVAQDSHFLLVGVDESNKVLRRTPKFLKAISLHVCIVNIEYIKLCAKTKDIVSLERHFIPLDSSGLNGPLRSFIHQNVNLLEKYVFFSLEKDDYLACLLESLIVSNGGLLLNHISLFQIYKDDVYKKIVLYGDNEESSITENLKIKMFTQFKAYMLNYKCLFNCVAAYDANELNHV